MICPKCGADASIWLSECRGFMCKKCGHEFTEFASNCDAYDKQKRLKHKPANSNVVA